MAAQESLGHCYANYTTWLEMPAGAMLTCNQLGSSWPKHSVIEGLAVVLPDPNLPPRKKPGDTHRDGLSTDQGEDICGLLEVTF